MVNNFFIRGFYLFCGFLTALLIFLIISTLMYPLVKDTELAYEIKNFLKGSQPSFSIKAPPSEPIIFKREKREDFSFEYLKTIVSNTEEFIEQIEKFNRNEIPTEIILKPGLYIINNTLNIEKHRLIIRSQSSNPLDTIISGTGMYDSRGNLFRVSSSYVNFEGITLQNTKLHLIQIAGESKSSYITIDNCIFRDSYQQLIKISYNRDRPNNYSSFGKVTNSVFYYTGGVAPNFYTGGIDGHGVRSWQIENNLFLNIASPSGHIAEHAIHLWNNSAFNDIRGNIIFNSDRGIGLGMGTIQNPNIIYGSYSDTIYNNFIFHTNNNHPFADTGIVLESTENTIIERNYVYNLHDYPRAIEYRFPQTKNIIISHNFTNKRISSRDKAQAILINNNTLDVYTFQGELNKHISNTNPRFKDYLVEHLN